MLDWTVILTPVLVLGVLLLVGYTGCSRILDFDNPVIDQGFFFVVRIPTALIVTAIVYRYDEPTGDFHLETDMNPTADHTTGGNAVYQRNCGPADAGTWVVGCGVEAIVAGVPMRHFNPPVDPLVHVDSSEDRVEAPFGVGLIGGGDFFVQFQGAD
jgi:hypothetical protein